MFALAILSIFVVGIIGYGLSYPTLIEEYTGSGHTGCHGSNTVGSGSLTATPTVSGRVVTVAVTITGFTEPTVLPYGDTISVGIPWIYGDNALFGHGIAQNDVHGSLKNWGTNIWEVNISEDSSFTFKVLAPAASGTYDLMVVALTGMNASGDAEPLFSLEDTISVVVSGATVSIASLALVPVNNLALVLVFVVGVLATGSVVLILKRKRK
ncbi:hypothetical protein LCGC14_0787380 [marine sediment metagenome]|uniref:Uncharacterized protein n=1 Tax=marine sediment metagenome TaxID=412755 RepID=A0A0F9QDF4_9ZZZZ|nr:hypothetical protein [bacterium]